MVVEGLPGPGLACDLDALDQAGDPLAPRHAQGSELLVAVAEPQTEEEPPAAEQRDLRRILSEEQRVVQWRKDHPRPEDQPIGARRDGAEEREDGRRVAVVGEVVLPEPEAVETLGLGQRGVLDDVGLGAPGGRPERHGVLAGEGTAPDEQRGHAASVHPDPQTMPTCSCIL